MTITDSEFRNGRVIGNIHDNEETVTWFVFSDNKVVTFHVATTKDNDEVIFYSDADSYASVTAIKLGIRYTFIRNATDDEAEKFIANEGILINERIVV